MVEHVQAVELFIKVLPNAKVARKDLISIITGLSALIADFDKHQSKLVLPAMASTQLGCTRFALIVDTTIPAFKNPDET